MSSPFSMLSRLTKARRASQKRVPGTDDAPPKDLPRHGSQSSLRSLATKAKKGLKGVGGKDGKPDSAAATPSTTPPTTPSLKPSALPAAPVSELQSVTTATTPASTPAATEEPEIPAPITQKAPDADWTELGSDHDPDTKEDSLSVTLNGTPDRSTPVGDEAVVVSNEAVVGSNEAAMGGGSSVKSHDASSVESAELLEAAQSVTKSDERTSRSDESARTAYNPMSEAAGPKAVKRADVDISALEDEKERLSMEVQRLQAEISTQTSQSEQRIAAIEEEKAAASQELERLRKEHMGSLQNEKGLSSEIDRLRTEISVQASQAEQRITNTEQEKASLSQELRHLRSERIVTLEDEKENLKLQLGHLRDEMAVQLSQREERVVAVELQKGHLSQEVRRLEEALTDLRKEKKLVEEALVDMENEKSSMEEDFRRLHAELTILAEEKEDRDQQVISLDQEREQLLEEVEIMKDEAQRMREDADTQKIKVNELERELEDTRAKCVRLSQEVSQTQEEIRRVREEGKKSENRSREENRRQLQAVHDKYASLERHNRMLQDQIRQQAEEFVSVYETPLKGQQTRPFGSLNVGKKSNTSTGEGVLATMDALNIAIFQVAASLADDLYLENNEHIQPVSIGMDEEAALISRMTDILGREVILVLRSTDQVAGQDPLPMQIALQASINYCCKKIMTSWYPGHWDYGDFLGVLYARIQGSEDVETAVKWRCVTRRQCNPSLDTQSLLSEFICSHLADVFAVAGWSSPSLLSANAERVSVIVRLALRVNKLIGEDTGPGHVEPLLVSPEARYDSNVMDNAYAEDDDDLDVSLDGWAAERVICTTDLGLQRIVKVDRREYDESADGPAFGHVVLRPKVVLRSVLEQL